MRRLYFFILLLPGFLAQSEEEDITFAISLSKPYGFYSAEGEPKGIEVDIAKLISNRSNISFDLHLAPQARAYQKIVSGKADLAFLTVSPETDKFAEEIAEVMFSRVVLVGLKDNNNIIQSLVDLKGKRVGYVKGVFYGDVFEKNEEIIKVPVLNLKAMGGMLVRKRIDYLLNYESSLVHYLNDSDLSDKVKIAYELEKQTVALYISKKAKRKEFITKQLSVVISQLQAEKKIKAITDQFTLTK